jgi:sulfur transfer protein SufE
VSEVPENLAVLLDFFDLLSDRADRIDALTSFAERLETVPERIAKRPYPESNRVPNCESQVYVWAEPLEDATLEFYFAVENPQGIAAMASAAILKEGLEKADPRDVARIDPDLVLRFFGGELSVRKSVGLIEMVNTVRRIAVDYLSARQPGIEAES